MNMKVFIAVPCMDLVHADFMVSLIDLLHFPINGVRAQVSTYRGCNVDRSRYALVKKAQAAKAVYILFLDSDMVFPPSTLARLLRHRKNIVGATATTRNPPIYPIGIDKAGETLPEAQGLVETSLLGAACLLVYLPVFDLLEEPWFDNIFLGEGEDFRSGDAEFGRRAREAGIKVWCDTDIKMGHIGNVTHYVT